MSDMFTIAVLSSKGGSGKTTLSTNLAASFSEQRGKTCLVVDVDPQASSMAWLDLREIPGPAVVTTPINRLSKVMEAARKDGVTNLIIDCPPHGDPSVAVAARQADLLLVPCRPAAADLLAMGTTVEIINFVDVPALVILNAVPSRGSLAEEARASLTSTGLKVWKGSIGDRVAFVRAYSAGLGVTEYEPKGKASEEIVKLRRQINSVSKK